MYLAYIYSGDLVVHLSISKTKKRELLHLRTAVVIKGPVKCLMWRQTLCLSSQRPLYGHIFQNNGIMVKSTIATKLMAILYRSHSTDGCVVTSIFTWGAACCRGHQQDVIYPFGAGFSNVTFHYLPCLVPSRCSDLFFFFFFPPAEIFNYLPSLMRFWCPCRHSAGPGWDSASSAFCEPLSTGWFENVVSIWGTFWCAATHFYS